MTWLRIVPILIAASTLPAQQTIDVGTGAPNETIRQRFVAAWFRNGFYLLVQPAPAGPVKKLGSTGLVQEFTSLANSSQKLALIKATLSTDLPSEGAIDVFQVQAAAYSYFNSLGVGAVGYPTMDTANCPPLTDNFCQYQLFDKPYALFTYANATLNGQNFATRNPFYTKWNSLGGMATFGPASSAETSVTSSAGTAATVQTFASGAIYNITSGALNGRLVAVQEPIYDVYAANGAHSGFLGMPFSEEVVLAGGRHRQTFEGGAIEYDVGSAPVLRLPVASIQVRVQSPVKMNLGDTLTLLAVTLAANGGELTGRDISWTTTNGRVVAVQGNGSSAVIKAVGGGTANVTAVSEGKSSPGIAVIVTAPCCGIGEGAPNGIVQQAFQDAVTRLRLNLKLPAATPVRRVGLGFMQEFQDAATSARYVIALPDRSSLAYVLTGPVLGRYDELGGPAGALGYPVSDPTSGGRQLFENGALAGNPVRAVTGSILAKWAALNYETGPAGPPAGDPGAFLTFMASAGVSQAFRDGLIFAFTSGAQAGKTCFVGGLILGKYSSLGGPSGQLGGPMTDEFALSGKRRQEFEGGILEYGPGDAEASLIAKERRPSATATPAAVMAGSRVRISVGGFDAGSSLRVSVSGLPDFLIKTQNGAYAWDIFVPTTASSGSVTIRAGDAATAASAQTSYTVRALRDAALKLSAIRGDSQVGPPGALLAQPLRVSLKDSAGNPVTGVAVRFASSPGSQISPASAVTDDRGEAEASLRLPPAEGVALATAEAAGLVITFSARAAQSALSQFPKLMQTADGGALLAAAASILRYHQIRGELPAPNGQADPSILAQFLKGACVFDAQGNQLCDGFLSADSADPVANLWRLSAFVSGGIDVSAEKPDEQTVRDLVSQGSPVLIALALSADGVPVGAHFVVATGVGADGGVMIHDPSSTFGRTGLAQYAAGFAAALRNWKASISAVARLLPRAPSGTGFLVASTSASPAVSSAVGACGATIEWPSAAAGAEPPSRPPGSWRLRYCEGSQSPYQIDLAGDGVYQAGFTDLGAGGGRTDVSGSGPTSYRAGRDSGHWSLSPQEASFTASGVLNAASFTPDIAPGGLVSIFGSGLGRTGAPTTVEIDDIAGQVILASPFQINAQVPPQVEPGAQTLRVRSPYGTAEQTIEVKEAAPALFRIDARHGAILNQDGRVNTPTNPASRGQVIVVFGTGFGTVSRQGSLSVVDRPVTAVLNGQQLPVSFAGLTPGFVGLYQVNVPIPAATPPGLDLTLTVRQGAGESNAVEVSIQ